jgi:replicative DNA helicase
VQSLNRVVRRGASDQHRIELPFVGLQRLNFGLAYGQLAMIAAGPGVGKSALALQLALDGGLPTLYISADTDSWTMTVRALAHLTGHQQTYITQCLEGGYAKGELALAMEDGAHVQWSFDSYTTADILDDVKAYAVVHGDWPRLLVVDNLMNIARGGDDDLSSQTKAMDELHGLAALTGACVLVLHHATGQYDDGDKPIPLSGLANKLSKLPAQVLTMHRKGDDVFVCPVKNRQGIADPSAGKQVRLRFDGERMTFRDGN